MSEHVALILNLGVLKKLFAGFEGGGGGRELSTLGSYGPEMIRLSYVSF